MTKVGGGADIGDGARAFDAIQRRSAEVLAVMMQRSEVAVMA